ncbi:hypothetical protein DUU50_12065 [Salmonella enterica subsp. enterica serovar Corvallis]|uniref:hypothetical protein n=1 Tax=Salmonella enterica TaxID=28901 RepID=UPI000FA445D9|nr:hypothetical protein [Salmonella enterica]EAA6139653.1 hypothetical protein [Salmonella enterica subsp. enterica serovar Corvallis]EED7523245.1 hypothetical protein [Salmonella enterica subsp. enterica serovar Blockley]EAA6790988.1 hypothetical protein [Salmonella enterica subsp. enterica serovar Corvallis]EAA6822080.1 hypothetical protein [Salmonella enterica subsp. enterica serovar Corvallis]EBL5792875.1 hypothetical protein [Salmonella enterica subsp. enterica serovar Corvallis]
MGSNIIELAKLGHERAAELKASSGAVDVRSLAQLISDLATQLEVQFVRSTDMAVQLANAESKCRELAAELSAVDKIHNEAVFITDDHYEQCPPEVQKMIRSLAVLQIPAYDAFLAEVRARAVDEACLKISNAIINCYQDEQVGLDAAATICGDFSAQLRKGAAL